MAKPPLDTGVAYNPIARTRTFGVAEDAAKEKCTDCTESSGGLPPPSPPAEKATGSQDQAWQTATDDGAGDGSSWYHLAVRECQTTILTLETVKAVLLLTSTDRKNVTDKTSIIDSEKI
jgi:uncharacterized protein YbbK (DUF523 family)